MEETATGDNPEHWPAIVRGPKSKMPVYVSPGTGPDRDAGAYRAMCKVARRLYSQEWWPVDGQWLPLNSDDMARDFDRDPEPITPAEADALADLEGPECP